LFASRISRVRLFAGCFSQYVMRAPPADRNAVSGAKRWASFVVDIAPVY
jgi:hypothetical protein